MSTLFGLVARTVAARQALRENWRSFIPSTFPATDDDGWSCDLDAGVVLYRARFDSERRALVTTPQVDLAHLLVTVAREGGDALYRQTGGFAAVFWDAPRRLLQMVRDPAGQCSIFIRQDQLVDVFCSEMTPLLEDPSFDCRLDEESAQYFLSFGLPLPGRTLARGIAHLPAGHVRQYGPSGPALTRRYFTPLDPDQRKVADDAWLEHIVATLDAAIDEQGADGRAAILLSGGVDSSYIATTCAARHGAEGYDAYTIEFEGKGVVNEVEYARLAADAAGIRLHPVRMTARDAQSALQSVLAQAQPCAAWAALTHHHLMDHIAGSGHRRVLSGLGADEVFGGYSRYLQFYKRLRRHEERRPCDGVHALDSLTWRESHAERDLFPGIPQFFDRTARRKGLDGRFSHWSHASVLASFYRECRQIKGDAHVFEMMVAHECQHRVPDLLFAGFEPMTRAHALQSGYPFLAPDVMRVACALGASERFWVSGGRWKNKKLLRRIALKRLPEQIITRKPASYTTPIRAWLDTPSFSSELRERLHSSQLWDVGLVRREWLHGLERQLADGAVGRQHGLVVEQYWVLTILAAWVDRWCDRAAGTRR